MEIKRNISKAYAIGKLERYCALSERCIDDVNKKMYGWGLKDSDREIIIQHLIAERFIDESRYAHAYARGKFNIKGRGRNKIQMELSQKGIDKEIIRDALREIDDAAYADKLKTLAIKKNKTILSENLFDRKTKLTRFLLSKGFEMDLIRKAVDEILPKK